MALYSCRTLATYTSIHLGVAQLRHQCRMAVVMLPALTRLSLVLCILSHPAE